MQPPAHAFGTRRDKDQCWKAVEAKTGFSSYELFLRASYATRPQFQRLWRALAPYGTPKFFEFGEGSVIDILKDGSTSVSLTLKGLPPQDSSSDPGTQLL